ncbi:hypothetical protein RUM43_001335 [Polyplax serrata]|uniref:Uncharacterized protein n=1 Tax=Polyplax serrata TaxID=468196 RepID=A0AAN8SEN1_POLSC
MSFPACFRIVRNKAAEKAKHVHHQQQTSQQSNNNNSIPHGGASVSVITHAPSVGVPHHTSAHHAAAAAERGTTAYSISGILGIPHPDPNGNIPKRKRDDIHPSKYNLLFILAPGIIAPVPIVVVGWLESRHRGLLRFLSTITSLLNLKPRIELVIKPVAISSRGSLVARRKSNVRYNIMCV